MPHLVGRSHQLTALELCSPPELTLPTLHHHCSLEQAHISAIFPTISSFLFIEHRKTILRPRGAIINLRVSSRDVLHQSSAFLHIQVECGQTCDEKDICSRRVLAREDDDFMLAVAHKHWDACYDTSFVLSPKTI